MRHRETQQQPDSNNDQGVKKVYDYTVNYFRSLFLQQMHSFYIDTK